MVEDVDSASPDASDVRVENADGAATAVGGRSGREARLDLLLAEELANDLGLLRRFLGCIDRGQVELPNEEPLAASVRLNVDDFGRELPSDCWGETDIEVLVSWANCAKPIPVLVEDKVWAPFQERQPERYRARAEFRGGAAVLVAPGAFLKSHKLDAAKFHGCIPIESIIGWLREGAQAHLAKTRRHRWRASLLEELIQPPLRGAAIDDAATVEFTAFCSNWFLDNDARVEPSERSLHSAGQGWLWFRSPRGLGYKAGGWARKDRAAVDLYVGNHGFNGNLEDLQRLLESISPPGGFFATTDTAKKPNVVLRFTCGKVSPGDGRPSQGSVQEASVIDALEACKRAAEWIAKNETFLK